MVKIKQDKIEEQLKKQDDDVYGTDYTDGADGKFVDSEEMIKDVTGNEPDPERDGFEMAEEVEGDEEARLEDKPEDDIVEEIAEIETAIEKIEKEKKKEDSSEE